MGPPCTLRLNASMIFYRPWGGLFWFCYIPPSKQRALALSREPSESTGYCAYNDTHMDLFWNVISGLCNSLAILYARELCSVWNWSDMSCATPTLTSWIDQFLKQINNTNCKCVSGSAYNFLSNVTHPGLKVKKSAGMPLTGSHPPFYPLSPSFSPHENWNEF